MNDTPRPIILHWVADVDLLRGDVIYTPEEIDEMGDYQALLDLCAKRKTVGNGCWHGKILASRRAAFERAYPEAFAPLNEIQQRHIIDYMEKRQSLSLLHRVRDKVRMPRDVELRRHNYEFLFGDDLYIQWYSNGDVLDAALCGYFTGKTIAGGPVVLARWSTEDDPPTYDEMSEIVQTRRAINGVEETEETYVGAAVLVAALLIGITYSVSYFVFGVDLAKNTYYGSAWWAPGIAGMLIGIWCVREWRRLRKKWLRDRFAKKYDRIAWAL